MIYDLFLSNGGEEFEEEEEKISAMGLVVGLVRGGWDGDGSG